MERKEANNVAAQYDKISEVYDGLFLSVDDHEEEKVVAQLIRKVYTQTMQVYEIGCGTGLLLSLICIPPFDYTGVDVSKGMVDKFKANHPSYKGFVKICDVASDLMNARYADCIVSIFGAMSYVDEETLKELASFYSARFLMFYREGYSPITYQKSGVDVPHHNYSIDDLRRIFSRDYVFTFNNYYIVISK